MQRPYPQPLARSRGAARGARLLGPLLLLGALVPSRSALAAQSCGGEVHQDACNSASNPYPCAEVCANGANCTWWAWEAACRNWRIALPLWSWTNEWADQAKLLPELQVSMTPSVSSIGCRDAHVAWVIAVSPDGATVTVTEQGCNGPAGTLTSTHPTSWFTRGFISKKSAVACSSGQTESRACGKCGQQSRTCGMGGQWGEWSACSGDGSCLSDAALHLDVTLRHDASISPPSDGAAEAGAPLRGGCALGAGSRCDEVPTVLLLMAVLSATRARRRSPSAPILGARDNKTVVRGPRRV